MMKKIVAIGGGTGLSTLLGGLKRYPFDISAIVTMTDSGFSTGRLRKEFGILPPGDIRKSIVALAEEESLLTELFNYRFQRGKGLSRHSLGNLLLLALEKTTGSFPRAIYEASRLLRTRGEVIPATLEQLDLVVILKSGRRIIGEHRAALRGRTDPIQSASLTNLRIKANPRAVQVVKDAHLILIGPGSLWTSVIPNFLLKDITSAVVNNIKAKKIYICNVSTERGETQGYTVKDYLSALSRHSHQRLFDCVLVNNKIIKTSQRFGKLGEIHNITTSFKKIGRWEIIKANLINKQNPLFHDPNKLAKIVWEIGNAKV